jgi:cardiolipin synthase A/B
MLKAFIIISYFAGFFFAAVAILRSRTPQGATAWVMSLISFPFISVPLYVILGRNKFEGYNSKRRILDQVAQKEFEKLKATHDQFLATSEEEMQMISRLIPPENQPGFTKKNKIKLLVNSEQAFPEMIAEIKAAKKYIIFQYYVVRGDETGTTFIKELIQKAREGVAVTFMNDAIGVELPDRLLKEMHEAGIQTGTFNESTHKGKLQINFRNHRKILVIDGKVAFLGGLNIGNEYRGITTKYGPWRDTNVRIEGPSVIAAQLASAKDWYCIHEKQIRAEWDIYPTDNDATVMVLHTGPADEKQTCLLSFIALINSACKRLWIANPYYVPPESLMDAILLAKLRGVDVRVLLPSYTDAKFVKLASNVYQKILLQYGVKVFRYTKGFLHQKVMLVDDEFAVVGSVNFDCRSMFINFEASVMTNDKPFINEMGKMLEDDYNSAEEVKLEEFHQLPILKKILNRGANLLAPIL